VTIDGVFGRWLRRTLARRPQLAAWPAAGAGDALVLSRGASATLDYIVAPELAGRGLRAVPVDTRSAPPPAGAPLPPAALALVVRYLPPGWAPVLQRLRAAGTRTAYLLDDDLFDAAAVAELPRRFRARVRAEALAQRAAVEAGCDEFWVSTPYLAQRYAAWSPRLAEPRPTPATQAPRSVLWLCYHGSTAHAAEFDWLRPLVATLLARNPALHFELFGDFEVYKRFQGLPRTSVLHPMPWPDYLAHTAATERHIGLVPLRPGRFNAGRGAVKFFDLARLGAVGVYSDVEPYRSVVRHGVDGLLLPDAPQAWVDAVEQLAADAPARARMVAAARARIAAWPGGAPA
jgi:hypothetical protein